MDLFPLYRISAEIMYFNVVTFLVFPLELVWTGLKPLGDYLFIKTYILVRQFKFTEPNPSVVSILVSAE